MTLKTRSRLPKCNQLLSCPNDIFMQFGEIPPIDSRDIVDARNGTPTGSALKQICPSNLLPLRVETVEKVGKKNKIKKVDSPEVHPSRIYCYFFY